LDQLPVLENANPVTFGAIPHLKSRKPLQNERKTPGRLSMTDTSKSGSSPSDGLQKIREVAAYSAKNGPFIVQSCQIAMNSFEKMINLQADVLSTSFSDMQNLVEKQGTPAPEVANEAYKLMIDKSLEHVRTSLAATQEMHKAYLDLMEGYLHTQRQIDAAKSKK